MNVICKLPSTIYCFFCYYSAVLLIPLYPLKVTFDVLLIPLYPLKGTLGVSNYRQSFLQNPPDVSNYRQSFLQNPPDVLLIPLYPLKGIFNLVLCAIGFKLVLFGCLRRKRQQKRYSLHLFYIDFFSLFGFGGFFAVRLCRYTLLFA